MQAVLDAHQALGPLPVETLTPEIARMMPLADRAAAAVYGQNFTKRALAPMPTPVGKVEHILIPGSDSDIPARVYTPKGDIPRAAGPCCLFPWRRLGDCDARYL